MDFYQIGALKVFSELGQLIENDNMRRDAPASLCRLKGRLARPLGQATPCTADDTNKTKFTDIPIDIMEIIKNHVTNFQNNDEEYNFLSNFKEGKSKDI